MSKSQVQRLRERIALEIQAMHYGFQGLAVGMAKHQFIEARSRNLGQLEDQLAFYIGEDEALLFTCQTYVRLSNGSEAAR